MKYLVDAVMLLVITISWTAGVIIAQGFWSTFWAVTVPFYAWYLLIEKLLFFYNVI